ncbi:MAG: hypothetical protein Q8O35_13020 [Humidesulfovibrio sp.]|uniref:hypothetical protein n=1 Tax=Humidesulfovibrio sp. TaxID=2910988 RepID=UPI00273710E2|nr:hypothetical protein [Humidesulfovibrio sp.]MDP2849093.1 hypothetical protein [Humidesulfovibrio sp.]
MSVKVTSKCKGGNHMIAQLIATATKFKAQLAKRLFARSIVLRRERSNFRTAMAYARVEGGRRRIDR